jgi:hypothetical protein
MNSKDLSKKIKFFLIRHILANPIFWVMSAYSHTLRFKLQNSEVFLDQFQKNGRAVLASWHQRFFGGFYFPLMIGRKISIMISQSGDGDFVADAVGRIGWIPVRGSSSRGGKRALTEMVKAVRLSSICTHIVDGPNGPPEEIKSGLIALAQISGAAIIPAFVSYEKPVTFNSWDKFMIPKPFSRVLIRFGSPIFVSESLDIEDFEKERKQVEDNMKRGYQETDRFWKECEKKSGFKLLFSMKKRK